VEIKQKGGKFLTSYWQFHVAFWLLYWIFGSLQDAEIHPNFKETLNLPIVLGSVGVVYFNYYYWIPKYLIRKKKYLFYGLSIGGLIFLNSWIVNFIVGSLIFHTSYYFSLRGIFIMSVDTSVLVAFTTAFKFMQQWNERNRYAEELEKKNLESELQMLKSQINPHFIFNTLNTIYFLMEQKDEKAKEVLLRFSNILSHQLYDYSKNFIDISTELDYLKNYIELQRMRHDEDVLDLKFHLPKRMNGYKIAPMLLIPFIENAFKHGRNATKFKIDIQLEITENMLHFITKNTISPSKATPSESGGIGLINVKRRLNLTYPNQHELIIKNDGINFLADLKIQLNVE